MALRGVGIGAEKNQLCAVVADDNRVASQVDVNELLGTAGKLTDKLQGMLGGLTA